MNSNFVGLKKNHSNQNLNFQNENLVFEANLVFQVVGNLGISDFELTKDLEHLNLKTHDLEYLNCENLALVFQKSEFLKIEFEKTSFLGHEYSNLHSVSPPKDEIEKKGLCFEKSDIHGNKNFPCKRIKTLVTSFCW